jgi:UDPglucose--hexose-1-phosphate uridylyltransferase
MRSEHTKTPDFHKLPANLSQSHIQKALEKIHTDFGFEAALDALYQWEYEAGYITDAKLQDNLRYAYQDPETGVVFRTQINIARSHYNPTPLAGKNSPPLHCPICFENIHTPGKENLRVFEFLLSNKNFFAQLTPFPLYPKHFVLISKKITPMIMNHHSIEDMVNFLALAPSYTVFSNSDVEWAGASILTHHHYQAIQNLKLPITEAKIIPDYLIIKSAPTGIQTHIGLLDFPMASCVIQSTDPKNLIWYGQKIIQHWRTPDPKNTCNLVLQGVQDPRNKNITDYFLYIIFRNPEHRTPESLKIIKSEGVGVIEVCGEGIYPVPTNPEISDQIKHHGLEIIKKIITGNTPLLRQDFPIFFKNLQRILD